MPDRVPTAAAMIALVVAISPPVRAGEADAVAAEAISLGDGSYRISATIRHADTGWDHYADRFDVLAPDGTVLGTRVLHYPHVDEQPFTRSLNAVTVPDGIAEVVVRAHDSVHGLGGATVTVRLPDR